LAQEANIKDEGAGKRMQMPETAAILKTVLKE
jgi:hypothetical protein